MHDRRRWQDLKDSWEWLSFAASLPARPQPLNQISAGTLIMGGRCVLTGGSALNLSTANGHIDIYDGLDNTGVFAWRFSISASGTSSTALPGQGVLLEIGCFVVPSGVVASGSLLLIPLSHYLNTPPGE